MTCWLQLGTAIVACLTLLGAHPSSAKAADDGAGIRLSLSGGPMGGSASMAMAAFMKAFLAAYPKAVVDLLPGNGTANPVRVAKGQVSVAHSQGAILASAKTGGEPYKQAYPNLRSLFHVHDDCRQLMFVRDAAPVAGFEDIRNKKLAIRLSPVTRGSTNDIYTRWILDAYGTTYEDIQSWGGVVEYLNFDGIVDAMKDGQLDMVGWSGPGYPSFLRQIMLTEKLRFLPLGEEALAKLKARGLRVSKVAAGEFDGAVPQDVPCVTDVTEVICSADLPDEIAYKIVKIWTEHREDIGLAHPGWAAYDPALSWKDTSLPLHPGAEKYFREAGYMK